MHCRKESCATWFGMFVSGVHSCHSCGKCQASTPDQKLQVPERDSMLYQFCIMLASSHPFVAAAEKKTCPMQRSRGFGHGVVVANIFKVQWLCSQLCYATAAHPWTVVEIELLATVGWTRGCQPFSCRCSQNVTHCRKEICSTCLSKESIPAIPFGISKHPLLVRSLRLPRAAVLRATVRSTSSVASRPSLRCSHRKILSHAEEQRVWSPSCALQGLLRTIHVMRLLQTNKHLSRRCVWRTAAKRFVGHVCLMRNPCLLWNLSLHSLPEAGSWEGQYAPPLCLHHVHPFVAISEKSTCLMRRSKEFGHGVVL